MARSNIIRLGIVEEGGQTVVRTFQEIGDSSEVAAGKVSKSAEASSLSFKEMEKGTNRLSGAVGTLAGTIGITGLAFGIKDVIEAGEKWQLQHKQLTNALKTTRDYSSSAMAAVVNSAENLSVHGGVAGPEQLEAMNQFIRIAHSSTQAIQMNAAATNLARGTGIAYGQAVSLVERAFNGSTRGMQKYLGIMEPVKSAMFALTQAHGFNMVAAEDASKAYGKLSGEYLANQEVLHNLTPPELEHADRLDKIATGVQVLQKVQTTYGNSTRVFSNSTAGAISNLSNHFELLGKTIGKRVLPYVTSLVNFMSKHVTAIFVFAAAVTALTITWGINAAVTADIIRDWSIADAVGKAFTVTTGFMAGALDALTTIMIGLGISATVTWAAVTLGATLVIAALVELVLHFGAVKKFIAGVFDWLKGAVSTVVTWIGGHWKGLLVVLTGPYGVAALEIGEHFAAIKRMASEVVSFMGRVFSPVFHVLVWPFQEAWKLISGIFGQIKAQLKAILGPVGTLLHALGGVGHGFSGFLAHPFGLHNGGIVHAASGGLLGGYGGGDRIPAMLEAGEGVLRKEAVASMGNQAFNAINTSGSVPMGSGGSGRDEAWVTVPVIVQAGARVMAETTAYVSAKRAALSGGYVTG